LSDVQGVGLIMDILVRVENPQSVIAELVGRAAKESKNAG
jgi:hypothetical protein